MHYTKTLLVLAAISLGAAGCAHNALPAATHAWNNDDKTSAEYRLDNFACLDGAQTNEQDLTTGDQRFKDYKRCMLDRGYALRTY